MTRAAFEKVANFLKIFVLITKYISSLSLSLKVKYKLNDKLFSLYIFLNTLFTVSSLTVEWKGIVQT